MPIINVNIPLEKKTYSVSELNKKSRQLLEKNLNQIQVEGEISNLAQPSSGHIYFRLKDAQAQIQCAFFRNKISQINFRIEEGLKVIANATVSLYEARGDYQLIIESLQIAGVGNLQLRFDALKKKLQAEGLFAQSIKKSIPQLPQAIGIITSANAAALHDILTTLKRRFPAIPLYLYPTQVQGEQAASQIAKQIQCANQHNQCDVLLLARGGGSIEDLWAFNEEVVAYAIYHSTIPIVSGVGHETDITLTDFCADLRCATPTAAAEAVSPLASDILENLNATQHYLQQLIQQNVQQRHQQLVHLQHRLKAPISLIQQKQLHIDALYTKLSHLIRLQLHRLQCQTQQLHQKLLKLNVINQLSQAKTQIEQLHQRLQNIMQGIFSQYQQQFKNLCTALDAISPLATLARGYSLTQDENKQLITDSNQLVENQKFWVTLNKGRLHCKLIGKQS